MPNQTSFAGVWSQPRMRIIHVFSRYGKPVFGCEERRCCFRVLYWYWLKTFMCKSLFFYSVPWFSEFFPPFFPTTYIKEIKKRRKNNGTNRNYSSFFNLPVYTWKFQLGMGQDTLNKRTAKGYVLMNISCNLAKNPRLSCMISVACKGSIAHKQASTAHSFWN